MTIFKIHESYIIRHEILKSLFGYAQKEKNFQRPKNRISLLQISSDAKIPFEKLLIYHELLHEEGEIICSYDCEDPNDHLLLLETKGRQSFIYEKYLKDGQKESRDNIKDNVAIFSPLLTILIAVASLLMSLLNYKNSSIQQIKIDSMDNLKVIKIDSLAKIPFPKVDSNLNVQNKEKLLNTSRPKSKIRK